MTDDIMPQPDQPVVDGGLSRRQFLQTVALTSAGAVMFTGCQQFQAHEFEAESRLRVAEDVLTGFDNWYGTTCTQCGAGCGLIVRILDGRAKKVEGNPDHPVNLGKTCARGQAAVQGTYHPDRIQGPMRRDRATGKFADISWEDALAQLTQQLRGAQGQSNGITFLTDPQRGQQALVLDRFTRALNMQWMTLDLLGEGPFREAARRMYGQDLLPEFDIQNARYVLSFGADFLGNWLSPVHYNMQYGVFREGNYRLGQFQPRQKGSPRGYLVQVEPRMSHTGSNADEWLFARPGTEGMVALSMAQVILSENLAPSGGANPFGSRTALDNYAPERIAQQAGISDPERIRKVAREFVQRGPSVAIAGGPVTAHTNGTDVAAAVLALNGLVGAVGRNGGVRFNPAPALDGLPTVRANPLSDWQQLATRMSGGQTRMALIYNANPVYSLPNSLGFRDALAKVPFIASFSTMMDETTAMADLVLPAHHPLEDWGADIPEPGPGYQVVSIQQPVVRPYFDTRSVWDVLITVAGQLGGAAQSQLPWLTFQDSLKDVARTLQSQNRGSYTDPDFARFWTGLLQRGGWWDAGRTQSAPATPASSGAPTSIQAPQFSGDEGTYPYNLVLFAHNTLGTGEAAHLPWLQAAPDPMTTVTWQTWVEMNPRKAAELGLIEGDVVTLESPSGKIDVPVYVNPAAAPTVLAVPMGQGHTQSGRWATRDGAVRGANPLDLLAPLADATSGALAYGATRVRVIPTGKRISMAKLEGNQPPFQIEDAEVAKVTREV